MPAHTGSVFIVTTDGDDTKASITFILIGTICASLLIPMFILLLCFSTRESRTRPLFYFNALALLFGILQGFMLSALYVRSILEPSSNLSGLNLAINIVFLFSPLLVESILLLRLVAVFPSATHGRRTLSLVLGFPIAIRIGRLINMCLAIARSTASSSKLNNNTSQWWALLPFIRLEWFLALVDNTYVSLVFLYRLRGHVPPVTIDQKNAMVSRLRRLFFIAGSNFIIPGLLNAVQLTLVFVLPKHSDPPARQSQLFFICAFIMIVFNYVCIIGVVFATIWATGSSLLSGSNQGSWPSGSVVGGTYSKVASTHRKVDFRPQGFRPMSSNDRVSIDNASIPLMDKESSTGHSQFQDKK